MEMPFDIVTEHVDVDYKSYPGWNSDLAGINKFASLPHNASDYILELERALQTKISVISTRPERDELIVR
jgi:adenylosuccinate synthase